MMRNLQAALEEANAKTNEQPTETVPAVAPAATAGKDLAEVTIELTGPLSQIYTDALNIAYAKPPNTDALGGTNPNQGLESQQIDVTLMSKLSDEFRMENQPAPTDTFQTVYGVSRDEVNEETVVDVTKRLVEKNPKDGRFIMVIDYTRPSSSGTTGGSFGNARSWDSGDYMLGVPKNGVGMTQKFTHANHDKDDPKRLNQWYWESSLEGICTAYGVPVFHSLNDYVRWTCQPQK